MDSPPPFRSRDFHDLASYVAHVQASRDELRVEEGLRQAHPDGSFKVRGYCWLEGAQVELEVDYLYSADTTPRQPNWRERLVCPRCRLNNRQRATMHLAGELGLRKDARVYVTERVTPLYSALSARYANLVGSEFLGDDARPGSTNLRGVRHEDLTRLSFREASFDAVLTFDVLEHVPDFRRAIAECFRVLAPGGALLLSVPFLDHEQHTRIRAERDGNGALVHRHPPQYHGDPVTGQGVLCFQEFGWDLLDLLREAGFEEACAIGYRSVEYGYLGGWPLMFRARKPGIPLIKSMFWQALTRILRP